MTTKFVKIKTNYIRLDQMLKWSDVAETGGIAKEMIVGGEVKYNGEVCTARGKKVYPGDEIETDEYKIVVE